jgi:transcriptional regulator with XRE-family HTH domain
MAKAYQETMGVAETTSSESGSTRFRFNKPARVLRMAREQTKLSQASVAEKMGADQAHVSKIEAGADVRVSTLANMARVLGYELMLVPIAIVPVVEALIAGDAPIEAKPLYSVDDEE